MRLWINLIWIGLLGLVPLGAQNGKSPIGQITFPLNRVFVTPAGTHRLVIPPFNMEVFRGDRVETRLDSRCEVRFVSGDVLRLDENSAITLEEGRFSDSTAWVESRLQAGRVWGTVRQDSAVRRLFIVRTSEAVVATSGGKLDIQRRPSGSTLVRAFAGEIALLPASLDEESLILALREPSPHPAAPESTTTDVPTTEQAAGGISPRMLQGGQQAEINATGEITISTFEIDPEAPPEWVDWNRRRDSYLNP